MKKIHKKYILLILLFGYLHVSSQTLISEVDTSRIEFLKVKEYLKNQQLNGLVTFDDIKPSVLPDDLVEGYHIIDREFVVKDSLENVWFDYLNTTLQETWNSNTLHLALCYSRSNDSIYYANDEVQRIIPGLIVYLDLKLLFGVKLAMAFEVTKIDEENKLIEFSYLEGNVTHGKQQLFFEQTPKGKTKIAHLSYYKSNSKARDKLYPLMHARLINKFHRNLKEVNNEIYKE